MIFNVDLPRDSVYVCFYLKQAYPPAENAGIVMKAAGARCIVETFPSEQKNSSIGSLSCSDLLLLQTPPNGRAGGRDTCNEL